MKKILFTALIGIVLSGCSDKINFYDGAVVKEIEQASQNRCKYTVGFKIVGMNNYSNHSFYDTCGKFQIGDTIKTYK